MFFKNVISDNFQFNSLFWVPSSVSWTFPLGEDNLTMAFKGSLPSLTTGSVYTTYPLVRICSNKC